MFRRGICPSSKSLCLPFLLLTLVWVSGCRDSVGTLYPVRGKVLLSGKPIKPSRGYVMLKPDKTKGNETKFKPSGSITPDGTYEIYTKERQGAPPGWYKVVVTAQGERPKPTRGKSNMRPIAKSLVPAKYGQKKTTPLSIEVVADPSPDAYDLDLKN